MTPGSASPCTHPRQRVGDVSSVAPLEAADTMLPCADTRCTPAVMLDLERLRVKRVQGLTGWKWVRR